MSLSEGQLPKKWHQKNIWRIISAIFLFVIIVSFIASIGSEGKEESTQKVVSAELPLKQKYPSLTDESMDRNFIFSCAGGDEIVLWDNPTDLAGGVRAKYRVPCGIFGWAFNKYYNSELKITFYAVNTNDKRVKNAYGWVTEDLLTWRDSK